MTKIKTKIEYVWVDGTEPTQLLRSKTKIVGLDTTVTKPEPEELPLWSFDGSSTNQASGDNSDCILRPVKVIYDPQRTSSFIAMCEVLNADGTPHKTNNRHGISNDTDWWFGFEQEYVMTKNGRPLGFPEEGYPEPQGKYYCGVGTDSVIGRELVEQHMDACLSVGLGVTGVNAEVMLGQWEYQLFGKGESNVADDLWLSRYILYRLAESHGINIELHPKPMKGDWNGSGMHVNFSNKIMREEGGEELMKGICEELGNHHEEHIKGYGAHNEERLTGDHETQSINEFSYGVSDRGASIRIPINVANDGWKGYLEDRRPSSNACPYIIVKLISKNVRILEPKLD